MTDKERIQIFKDELKPLYANLMNSIKDFEYSKAAFCLQWGKNFPSEEIVVLCLSVVLLMVG